MEIVTGREAAPWSIMIYGVPGVGKSTLAKYAPNPVFINLENGIARIDCARTPHLRSWNEFFSAMKWAKTCDYKTIVIDTMGALENLLTAEILKEVNEGKDKAFHAQSLADKDAFPYGAGGAILRSKWGLVVSMIEVLQASGKNVVCVAHETIHKVQNPDGEDYDRYAPNIHKKSVDFLVANMDAVFFCKHERVMRQKEAFAKTVKFAQDTGKRVIQTTEKVTALAKNRFDLPSSMPFSKPEDSKAFFEKIN